MYCGMTFRLYGDLDILFKDMKFHFEKGGEQIFKATYRGMHVKLNYACGYAEVRGSIHKFKNNGEYNYDRLTVSDFLLTIKEFEEAFHLNEFNQKYILNFEFGVNIRLTFNPTILLESIIPYTGTGVFTSEKSAGYSGIKIKHKKYYDVKLYNKSNQIPINKKHSVDYKTIHVLRLEIKVYNMKFLNGLASKTSLKEVTKMSDFVHPEILGVLKGRLIGEFGKLLIVDRELFDVEELSSQDKGLYNKAWLDSFWKQYEDEQDSPKKRALDKKKERDLKRLKSIIHRNNDLKNSTLKLLTESLEKITDTDNVAISSIWEAPRSEIYLRKKGDHEALKERLLSQFPQVRDASKSKIAFDRSSHIDTPKRKEMSQNPYLDKLGICDKELKKYTRCPITGLPLFLNQSNAKYLSFREIEYYYYNHPEVYILLLRRIGSEYKSIPLEMQFKKIAQEIRNDASYKRRKREKASDKMQLQFNF